MVVKINNNSAEYIVGNMNYNLAGLRLKRITFSTIVIKGNDNLSGLWLT